MSVEPGSRSASRRATTAWTAKSPTVTGERSSLVSAGVTSSCWIVAGQERRLADRGDCTINFGRVEHREANYPARIRTLNEGIKIPSVTITLPGKRRLMAESKSAFDLTFASNSASV